MKQRVQWRPGYVAMVIALVTVVLVLFLSYRPAVNWFNAVNNAQPSPAPSDGPPTLPVTGGAPVPDTPGFPWWAFAVITATLFLTLFLWRAGYKNVLAASSHATASAAERRARSYAFNADVYHRLDEKKTARYLGALAGTFARTALALRGTSKALDRIETAGAKLDLPPVGDADAANIDAQDYQGMPPRLDSLSDE